MTILNTFAYHAYWEERISQGFGQVDGLEFKVVHGLLISSTDYREWGLSLFDATIQFLTSWQGLTFYAIVLVILLLQLTPLLAMRSKYFVPVTILLDSCCWAGYISLFARKAIQHPYDGIYPTVYIVFSAVLLLFSLRYYLCLVLDSSNIGRYISPTHLPEGMALKGAGASAEQGDRLRRGVHYRRCMRHYSLLGREATRIPEWNLGKNIVVVPDDEAELWEAFRGKLDISVYDEVSFKRLVV